MKSTCRRTTSDTRRGRLWAAVTAPIVPRMPTPALTGPRFALTMSKSPLWDTGRGDVSDGSRASAARADGAPGPAVRRLRPRAVLRDPLRILRLQHLHARLSWAGANPGGLAGGVARRAAPGRGPPRRRAGRWTPSSSAAARRRCWAPPASTTVLDAVREHFTLAPDAEVTTEANPESTSPEFFARLRAAGFTRVSLGMQSTAPHVLAALDRVHSPGRALDAAREARAAGFDHVNIDLIYGTPGETDDDLLRSVDAAIGGRGRPRLGVRADRRGRHRAGPAGAPRRDARSRRRRAGPPLRTARRAARRRRLRLVRGVELGTSRRAVPAQPRLLGRRRVVGRRARARTATSTRPDGGMSSTPTLMPKRSRRGALPVADFEQLDADDLAHRGRDAAGAAALRAAGGGAVSDQNAIRAAPRGRRRAAAPDGDRLVLTDRGRLLADAVVRDLLG